MHETNKLMAGVAAAMLLGSPGPSLADGEARDGEGPTRLAQTRPAADVDDVEDAVAMLLHRTPKESAKSLDDLMPRMSGIPRETAQRAIDNLYSEDLISRVGAGTPDDPYRYWSMKGFTG